ncbi:hypothetical protein KMZ30_07460 [Phycicoccus sp. KQZ13P-1]|uniref:hypothetical protein n=1 Tax=Phycicoccus mangrovi TaxID=2840470 RepID=UPI001C0012A4|nr:hypothetical protein [Phycicoccus mangrovi]MBT9255409.1 hypothetical protein [Phycicoccus mangrovi]
MNTSTPAGKTEWQRQMRRAKAYGRWQPFVDPAPAVEHVHALRNAYGLSYDAVAALSGLPTVTFDRVVFPALGVQKIRRETAEKILAARFDLDRLPDSVLVDVAGTSRRLRALAALGYSTRQIGDELGIRRQSVGTLMHRTRRCSAGAARAVRDLYDRWSMTPGPDRRLAATARAKGWLPPLAWDDDVIDRIDGQPDTSTDPVLGRGMPHEERTAEILWLLEADRTLTAELLGLRMGISASGINSALRKSDRQDIIDLLERNARDGAA